MNFRKLIGKLTPKKTRFIIMMYIFFSFIIVISASIYFDRSYQSRTYKGMKNMLTNIQSTINNRMNIYDIKGKSLQTSRIITLPLELNLFSELKDYMPKFKQGLGVNLFMLTDNKGNTIYNNSELFKSKSDYSLKRTNYHFIKMIGKKVYFVLYFPVLRGNIFIGSFSCIIDVNEFKSIILKKLQASHYDFVSYSNDSITDIYQMKTLNLKDLKYVLSLNVLPNGTEFLSNKLMENRGVASGTSISLVIKKSVFYNLMRSLRFLFILLIILSANILWICVLLFVKYYNKKREQYNKQMETFKLERHDFIKHINVVNALAYDGDTEELKKYVASLNDSLSMNFTYKTLQRNSVSALLSEKEKLCKKQEIEFDVYINTSLGKLNIPDNDLCSMIGNTIDNAIEAVQYNEPDKRGIEVIIYAYDNNYIIDISNVGSPIDETDLKHIFEYGYTTKKDKLNHGMGLFIVSKLIEKYKGFIEIVNNPGNVSFKLYFPFN